MPKGLRESTTEDENWCAKCTNYWLEQSDRKIDDISTGTCKIDNTIVKRSQLCDEFKLDGVFYYIEQTIQRFGRMSHK